MIFSVERSELLEGGFTSSASGRLKNLRSRA